MYSNYHIANDDDNIENQTSIENVDKITNVNCSVSRKDLVVNKNPSLENEKNKSIIEIESINVLSFSLCSKLHDCK